MARCRGAELLLAAVALAGLAGPVRAQGGWRQWDVVLRGGHRIEANPLGAPDSMHLSISVAGFERGEQVIHRSAIDHIAAQTTVGPRREPIPGESLPDLPVGRMCTDLVVRRDGRQTTGRVAFTRIRFSEGIVTQRGVEIDLADVAYIRFAACSSRCGRAR